MKIKCNKKEFKLEIFIIVLSIVSILIHLYKIIFMHDKLNTELIITLVFLILVIVAIILISQIAIILVNAGVFNNYGEKFISLLKICTIKNHNKL